MINTVLSLQRIILVTLTTILSLASLQAQDGSDMLYAKPYQIDSTFVGDFVHIDYYRPSRKLGYVDTVTLLIDNVQVRFFEHREDDGFNNWFQDQYLQSVEFLIADIWVTS